MTLSAIGDADTPAGGSVCIRLKSRINLRLAAVDMVTEQRCDNIRSCDFFA